MPKASDDHIREANAAANNVESGSRAKDANGRMSNGIFRSFGFTRMEYVATWLRNVYGEEL